MPAVRLRDVSPRLTFQAHSATTEQKVELIDRLIATGVPAIEVSSFVHPKLVPGLADAAEVFAKVQRKPGVSLECCVPNASGLKRAIDAGADAAWFLLAADEEFSKANIGRTVDESLAELERMQQLAAGSSIKLGTYLIAVFGGPLGLPRKPEDVSGLAERLIAMGVKDWILADSCGYAAPPQIRAMIEFAAGLTDIHKLNVQVHDSRGMGLANVVAMVEAGIVNVDTSLAGSGAHPAAPGMLVGGTCTEDVVQMLHLMEVDTGIDLAGLIETANWLDKLLGGNEPGFVRRSGKIPDSVDEASAFRQARSKFDWNAREKGTQ